MKSVALAPRHWDKKDVIPTAPQAREGSNVNLKSRVQLGDAGDALAASTILYTPLEGDVHGQIPPRWCASG